jgi:hypothetical protein
MVVTVKKIEIDKVKVTITWLVAVKLYGIIPIRLQQRRKVKVVNRRGKYFFPAGPTCSSIRLDTNSYIISAIDCQRLGTKVPPLVVTNERRRRKSPVETNIKRDEFVKDK